MNISLEGKRALVCGSTQGIGKAIATEFAHCGASLVLIARDQVTLQAVCNDLPTIKGVQHSYIVADFNKPESVIQALHESSQSMENIDIVVNNSGGPPGGKILDATPADFLLAMNRLLMVSHVLVQEVVEGMKQRTFGRIINIISTSVRQPIDNLGVSNTIRGATASWAKTLATETAAFGITVNNILPGATATARLDAIIKKNMERTGKSREEVTKDMQREIPAGRFAQPEEIAALATFLASDYAGYITGTSIAVDGGRTRAL